MHGATEVKRNLLVGFSLGLSFNVVHVPLCNTVVVMFYLVAHSFPLFFRNLSSFFCTFIYVCPVCVCVGLALLISVHFHYSGWFRVERIVKEYFSSFLSIYYLLVTVFQQQQNQNLGNPKDFLK